MPETPAKKIAKQELPETQDFKPLSQLLGESVAASVKNRSNFPFCKMIFVEWYNTVKATKEDKKEFAKEVMRDFETLKLVAEGLFSQAMEVVGGDR